MCKSISNVGNMVSEEGIGIKSTVELGNLKFLFFEILDAVIQDDSFMP